ncbi:MAG: PD40 domain-containing protein [Planctomyces sp.]|nr:PD40 domain-containing protein [Planctomyces sp.]
MTLSRRFSLFVLSSLVLTGFAWAVAPPSGGGGGTGGGGGSGSGGAVNYAFVYQDSGTGDLYLTTSGGAVKTKLTSSGKGTDYAPAWSPDLDLTTPGHQGYIAFFRQYDPRYVWGGIFIVPSDMSTPPVEVRSYKTSDPRPPSRDSGLSWTPDGLHIVYASDFDRVSALSVATGNVTLLFKDPQNPNVAGYTYDPSLSPDQFPEVPGYQGFLSFSFAFDIVMAPVEVDEAGVWTVGPMSNLTQSSDVSESRPVWSPDGSTLAYFRGDAGTNTGRGLNILDVATGDITSVINTYQDRVPPCWSPDGLFLGFHDAHQVSGKWTTDVFYVSPWDLSPRINVTKTNSSSSNEVLPNWNPAWVNDIP